MRVPRRQQIRDGHLRLHIIRVGAREHIHRVRLDPRHARINLLKRHCLVHRALRREVAMRRPVMTVHAVHLADFHLRNVIRKILVLEHRYLARGVRHAHPGNLLACRIRRHIFHIVARQIVPVNAAHRPARRIAPANLQQQPDRIRRVRRITLVISERPVQVAHKLLRPVALLARVARRTQILDRRADRPRILVKRHRIQLVRPRNLRLHKPRNALAHVTFHARHPRMRTVVVRHLFRLHHLVADLPAERR